MGKLLSEKEFSRMTEEYDKVKYMCKCGHKVVIPYNVDKQVCSWCKRYVFKSKKDEALYRIKEKIKNG